MEIIGYLYIIWHRKWVVLATVVVTLFVAFVGTGFQTPIYQTSAFVRIAASSVGNLEWYEYQYISQLMNTYVEITTSDVIMDELSTQLGIDGPLNITVEVVINTELIKITVEDTDPRLAATAANTLAEILKSRSNTLYIGGVRNLRDILGEYLAQAQTEFNQTQQEYGQLLIATPGAPDQLFIKEQLLQEKQRIYEELQLQYERSLLREETSNNMVTIVQEANVPQIPIKPERTINYGLGFLAGVFGGIVLAFVFENLGPKLYSMEDVQATSGAPILGKHPKIRRSRLNISRFGNTLLAESFRRLATTICQHNKPQPRKTLLITSVDPKQGKSMIASNLAIALAEHGEKVIVIDCNLRSPKQDVLFHLPNESGLKEILEDKLDYKKVLQESAVDGVKVITSGSRPENPHKLLISAQMGQLIGNLAKHFDRIILDTPAILPVADAFALSQTVDGVILVVRRAHTQRKDLQESKELLEQLPEKFIGVIVNEA